MSCRTHVENTLQTIDGITSARVNLENEEAIIQMASPISTATLQDALPKKYTITERQNEHNIGEL